MLDEIDRRILRRLQSDGRLSLQELAEGVGLSPTPVARRLRVLEKAGIITGYRAMIDEVALGFTISVFVSVRLDQQVDKALETFESRVRTMPEVVDCWLMTGNRDYLMRVVTTNLAEFEGFLVGRLTKIPGVASIESSLPLRRVKADAVRMI
jgi:Lrp/AsnC family leucine-responsive transcriptional regulator